MAERLFPEDPTPRHDDEVKVCDFAATRSSTARPIPIPEASQGASTVPKILVNERTEDASPADEAKAQNMQSPAPEPTEPPEKLVYSTFYSPDWTLSQATQPSLPRTAYEYRPTDRVDDVPTAAVEGSAEYARHTSSNSKWSGYST